MASIYSKSTPSGTKLHYIKFKDVDGKWHDRNSHCATRKAAERLARDGEERVMNGKPFFVEPKTADDNFVTLSERFLQTLRNRSKRDDKSRMHCHLVPQWGAKTIAQITLPAVMLWIDDMKAGKAKVAKRETKSAGRKAKTSTLSESTMRHNMNLLSRFFGWAIERGLAESNPVRMVPVGKRPRPTAKTADRPWLTEHDEGKTSADLMKALAPPWSLLFWLGNRSGLRPGESLGLRMSDLGYLDEGVIRVRFSYDGCLKEDKYQTGLVKWVPAAHDAKTVLGTYLKTRKLQGAKAEDYAFPHVSWDSIKQLLADAWKEAADALGIEMTFYEATRHSFTSRNLQGGASLDEVSAALGHSSPVVTRRYYDHFVRKSFSDRLRAGI